MASISRTKGPQLSTLGLHPTIWDVAAHLFDGGPLSRSGATAGRALEIHPQTIGDRRCTVQDLAKLLAIGGDRLRCHFAALDREGKACHGAREGAVSLVRGAMMGVRNPVSLPEWPNPPEMLAVLSFVAHLVDQADPVD